MKRPASAAKSWSVAGKCSIVSAAISDSDAPAAIKKMLEATLSASLGGMKDTRHPYCARFAAMIGEVLAESEASYVKDVSEAQAAADAVTPAKAGKEEAVASAEATLKTKEEELTSASTKLTEAKAASKSAAESLKEKEKEQKEGDKEYEALEKKKGEIVTAKDVPYASLVDATAEDTAKALEELTTVTTAFEFDSSLLQAVGQVLTKPKDARTGFDVTCLEQMAEAFATCIGGWDAKIAEATPAKEARAAAVDSAKSEKEAADAALEAAKAAQAAAKEATATAKSELKTAKTALADYMNETKDAIAALEDATGALTDFKEGALAAFEALKERNEEWKPPAKKVKVAEEPAAEEPAAEEPMAVEAEVVAS